MSAVNPVATLPLFAASTSALAILNPSARGQRKGHDGATDAAKHLRDHAPGWVLERLGDALLSLRGREFTSDDVRRIAGPTVDAWLSDANVPERRNCFSGWFTMRRKAFQLVRVGSVPSSRPDARGRFVSVWRFPT